MALSDNMRGAGLMVIAMAAFTFNDAAMKTLSGEVPLFQAIFLRGLATTLWLFLLGRAMGGLRFRLARRDWGAIALRTFCEGAATFFFLTALFNAPIANVTAILQSLPLSVALAAALFLREPLGWRRVIAILVGLAGVILIVRPGGEGFNSWSLYALAAVGFVTIRDLSVRRPSADVPSLTVALVGAGAITLAAGLAAAGVADWAPVDMRSGATIGLASLFILAGYLASVMTMRQGERLHRTVSLHRHPLGAAAGLAGVWRMARRPDPDRRHDCGGYRYFHAVPRTPHAAPHGTAPILLRGC